jgi:peroxiredoxin Q/BCP
MNFLFLLADEDKRNSFELGTKKKFMGKEYDGIHRTTFIMNEGYYRRSNYQCKTKEHLQSKF